MVRERLNENVSTEQDSKLWKQRYHMQISKQRDLQKRDKKTKMNSKIKTTWTLRKEHGSRSRMFQKSKEVSMAGLTKQREQLGDLRLKRQHQGSHWVSYSISRPSSEWNGKSSHAAHDGSSSIVRLFDIYISINVHRLCLNLMVIKH